MLAHTHDSGSNNNTLAEAIQVRLSKYCEEQNKKFEWDHKTERVRCVCHKLALIVNAGLQALGIQAPPPPLVKLTMLGDFPVPTNTLQTVVEEDESGEGDKAINEANSDSDDGEVDDLDLKTPEATSVWYDVIEGPHDEQEEAAATDRNAANAVRLLTTKVSDHFLFLL